MLPFGDAAPVTEQIIRGQDATNVNLADGHTDCVDVLYYSLG